jgi:DNA-binding transcriptional regulator YhcF (GntR family)
VRLGATINTINYLKVLRFIGAYKAGRGDHPSVHAVAKHFNIRKRDVYRAYNWLRKNGYAELITGDGKIRTKLCH